MTAPTVDSVYPSNGATGIPIGATVFAIFDQEIDPEKVEGAFFVIGPDHSLWTGPDQVRWNKLLTPEPQEFLDSPGYHGIVQGEWSVEKIDDDGNSVSAPSYSPGGGYRSKAIFTPTNFMAALTDFTVFLAGQEAGFPSSRGIRSRTIWDTQLGSNLGDGNVVTGGSYTGTANVTAVIEITKTGGVGVAEYDWYWQNTPSIRHSGICSSQDRPLDSGVEFYFTGTDFRLGDTYTIALTPAEVMDAIYTYEFTTGSGSIETIPSTTSTSPTGDPVPNIPPFITEPFGVDEISPEHRAINVPLGRKEIVVTFNKAIDPDTITQESVRVFAESVLGSYDGEEDSAPGEIAKALEVSGSTLTITI